MSDPMLEEIWRVRKELIRQHGGLKGYIKYVQKLECANAERQTKTRTRMYHEANRIYFAASANCMESFATTR